MFYVYLVTCVLDGRVYVGETNNPRKRWRAHRACARGQRGQRFHLHNAMAKYGETNFTFDVVASFASQDDAFEYEAHLIEILHARDPEVGFNIKEGGRGGALPPESIARMAASRRGKATGPRSAETCKRISDGLIGRRLSAESRAKISASLTGRARSPEAIAKFRATVNTTEGRAKLAARAKPWSKTERPMRTARQIKVAGYVRKWRAKKRAEGEAAVAGES